MKRNLRPILLVSGIFLVLIALNFLFFVDTPAEEETELTGSRSSYRSTPYGTRAFYTLLQESGFKVTRLESPYTELATRKDIGTLVLIAPPAEQNPSAEEFTSLVQWVQEGGYLIIIDREIELDFGGVSVSTDPGDPNSPVRRVQPSLYTRGVRNLEPSRLAARVRVQSESVTYHFGDGQSGVLADLVYGEGRVVFLTDPFLVANNGISRGDNVVLALNLLSPPQMPEGSIAFDEFHHGYGSKKAEGVMSYFRGTPVPWMLGQTALIAVLVVYTYGRRFGRPIPLRRERRTTNLEFVSSMANITRLARASDLAMQSIYTDFRRRLCRYAGVPTRIDSSRLATLAARRAGIDESELKDLLRRCEMLAQGTKVDDPELLKLVSRVREIESRLSL